MKHLKTWIVTAVIIATAGQAAGQAMYELQSEREQAVESIRTITMLLEQAKQDENASLERLNLITRQINNRNRVILNIRRECKILDDFIAENTEAVAMMQDELTKLKDEYARMIRFAQKNSSNHNLFLFIVTADDVNQAYKRMQYMRQYTQQRKAQLDVIASLTKIIDYQLAGMEKQKIQKMNLLNQQRRENAKLEAEKREQAKAIEELRQRQDDLNQRLQAQEYQQNIVNLAVESYFNEQSEVVASAYQFRMTPEQQQLAVGFLQNRGQLPWPVERGIITAQFGVHPHPLLSQITIKNSGIDINTNSGAPARAVYAGEVSRVFAISGGNMSVIVRHGRFLTVYSNLASVFVRQGQQVSQKQALGVIFTDPADNKTVLKFQVWENNRKLNPQDWLAR
ncbi:MAG: peptidoglycan DD-metalloendopeptidase family protein [Bacteroidales bacterium]|jgi:murein DD-endopeptidase MepM/ murein hydrolase activator NlpD|nr:peptidoglycan DD-metalloendopeptidase family protein [Bacteroidales bacterium]